MKERSKVSLSIIQSQNFSARHFWKSRMWRKSAPIWNLDLPQNNGIKIKIEAQKLSQAPVVEKSSSSSSKRSISSVGQLAKDKSKSRKWFFFCFMTSYYGRWGHDYVFHFTAIRLIKTVLKKLTITNISSDFSRIFSNFRMHQPSW